MKFRKAEQQLPCGRVITESMSIQTPVYDEDNNAALEAYLISAFKKLFTELDHGDRLYIKVNIETDGLNKIEQE